MKPEGRRPLSAHAWTAVAWLAVETGEAGASLLDRAARLIFAILTVAYAAILAASCLTPAPRRSRGGAGE